jgi:hypothetical protein
LLTPRGHADTHSAMRKRFSGAWSTRPAKILFLGLALGLVASRSASGGPAEDDGVPSGMVAHVTGGVCPVGWAPAANVEGRLVVAVAEGKDVGVQVGEPLGDRDDRTHEHAYAGSLALPAKAISAADGPNQTGAASLEYAIAGTTSPGVSGLPFVQVLACVKQ